jgi:hypothetical protein
LAQETTSSHAGLIANLLNTLIRLQSHLRLYGEKNTTIEQTTSGLFGLLGQLFEKVDPVSIYVARHGFIYEDGLINRSNKNFESFANRLFQHGIASLTLHNGILPQAIHGFLALVDRKPSETWDEGGIENCLRLRNIALLEVREMVEQDFLLTGGTAETGNDWQMNRSLLWERLAMSIVHEQLFLEVDGSLVQELSPSSLAGLTNRNIQESTEEARNALARELSRFLISLKHEKIRIYRMNAIRQLTEYVNTLSPDLRNLFLSNAFNLNLDADLSEGFMTGLSDQIILDALQNASMGSSYTPPVIMKLLGRLAEERGIMDTAALAGVSGSQENATRLKILFRSDEFDNYVPKQYQDALLNIVKSDRLPNRMTEHIEKLKVTLEQSSMDHHVGEILLEVLRGSGDQIHANAIRGSLITTLDFYLKSRNYDKLKELYRLCASDRVDEETRSEMSIYFSSEAFTSTIFNNLAHVDKVKAGEIWEVIFCLGSYFVDPLLERLGEETDRSARRTYLTALSRLGEECKVKVIARLADSRWFVTRNLLYLLREFGDPAMLPHIRRFLGHPHPKVQQEALKACLLFRDAKAIPALLKAMETKEESALIIAINLAGFSSDPQVAARLISLLRDGSRLNYHLEIRKAAAKALVMASPQLALPVFQEILISHSLLQSRLHDSLKIEIIAVLDSFPADVAGRMLQDLVMSGSPEVARVAQAALTRITGTRQHE